MGGIFGVISEGNCAKALFYGTDYHSHLGTENAGLAIWDEGFSHTIHSISEAQFKSRFVGDYKEMTGNMGIGAIDDDSPQPLIIRSKFGTYALAATGLITNKDELTRNLLRNDASFNEMAGGGVNSVELVAKLINRGESIVDGIVRMQRVIEGSVCLLLMTREGIYAARDRYGRFPLSIGKGICEAGSTPSYAAATESSSFLMFPCRYASSTRTISELASHRAIRALENERMNPIDEYLDHSSEKYRGMIEWIRQDLDVTSLKYIHIEEMIAAIGLPEEQLCLYCWRGR
jgi:glutamine phosphoribosylpyrophosphate amidotransferase